MELLAEGEQIWANTKFMANVASLTRRSSTLPKRGSVSPGNSVPSPNHRRLLVENPARLEPSFLLQSSKNVIEIFRGSPSIKAFCALLPPWSRNNGSLHSQNTLVACIFRTQKCPCTRIRPGGESHDLIHFHILFMLVILYVYFLPSCHLLLRR